MDTPGREETPELAQGDTCGIAVQSPNYPYSAKIDHLRFLAAFIIICFHTLCPLACISHHISSYSNETVALIAGHSGGLTYLFKAMLFEGSCAVGLFMTLSGFLFARICNGKQISYKGFLQNRLLRIYPLFVSFIFLAGYLSRTSDTPRQIFYSIFCLQNIAGVHHPAMTPHLWTVAVEFQFYLLFPFLLVFHQKSGNSALLRFILLAALIRALVYLSSGSTFLLAYGTLFGRIDQFLIGMMLGFGFNRLRPVLASPLCLPASILLLIGTITLFHNLGGNEGLSKSQIWIFWPTIEGSIWGLFIASYCASSLRLYEPISKLFAFLGNLSFSMYVVHFALISMLVPVSFQFLEPILARLHLLPFDGSRLIWATFAFATLIFLPVISLISWLTYTTIEKPFLQLRCKYIK